jgi:effector-binding domain-containing protein
MIDTPKIVETQPQLTAVIHLAVPRDQMQTVMGPGLSELRAALAAQNITPTGPWFTHHYKITPDIFDFEIGVPVDETVVATGRVKAGQLPATQVARTVYRGPYEGLAGAWGELMDWIKSSGHKQAADLWEVYAVGPDADDDPAHFETELNRPLIA